MRLSDHFRTGWRNLRRQKTRSSLTVFAIVIGAMAVTVMLSLVTSAKGFLVTSFEKTAEDRRVIVTPLSGYSYSDARWQTWSDGTGKRLDESTLPELEAIPGVESTTLVTGVGFVDTARAGGVDIRLKDSSFNVAYEPNGTVIRDIVAGRALDSDDADGGVLISRDLATEFGWGDDLDAAIGEAITLLPRTDFGPGLQPLDVTVVGVMFADGNAMDMSLEYFQKVEPRFERCDGGGSNTQPTCTSETETERNGYGAAYISMTSKDDADMVVAEVTKLGYGAAAGVEELDAQNTAFTIIGAVLGGIGAIALFVAAIGVINTMVMATLERTREIGIMRAVGATKKTIRRLFTIEAGVLGFLGGAIGVALSFGIAVVLNGLLNKQLEDSGIADRDVVSVPPHIALVVIAITTLIGMLAGRLPARRAARLDPVVALRYD